MKLGVKLANILREFALQKQWFGKFIQVVDGPQIVCNINYNGGKQKKILLCYLSQCFEPAHYHISHSNVQGVLSMVNVFIKLDFCIDVCYCNDEKAYNLLQDENYDYIFGFGKTFDKLTQKNKKATAILIVTENDPNVVETKYKERIKYFRERHPKWNVNRFKPRNNFYFKETFRKYNIAIIMTSSYNINKFIKPFQKTYQINVNGLYNKSFSLINKLAVLPSTKNKFLWFGSLGLLHKGLDILIDVFELLPDFTLDIYGAVDYELKAIKSIPSNVHIMGRINVLSDEFIRVAESHRYVISASCSEGMNTGIITCMLHGLIPIVTRETGIETQESVIEINSIKVEELAEQLKEVSNIDYNQIFMQSKNIYEYAQSTFTLENFTNRFEGIVKDIIKE